MARRVQAREDNDKVEKSGLLGVDESRSEAPHLRACMQLALAPMGRMQQVADDALALKIKAGEVIFGERSVDEEPGDSAPKSSAAKHEEARKAAATLRKAETLRTENKRAAIGDSVPLNSSATSSSFSSPLLHFVGNPQQAPLIDILDTSANAAFKAKSIADGASKAFDELGMKLLAAKTELLTHIHK